MLVCHGTSLDAKQPLVKIFFVGVGRVFMVDDCQAAALALNSPLCESSHAMLKAVSSLVAF